MTGELQVEVAVREVRNRDATYAEGEAKLARLLQDHDGMDTRHRRLAEQALAFLRRAQAEKFGHSRVKFRLGTLLHECRNPTDAD
jgi:hypothetical protein